MILIVFSEFIRRRVPLAVESRWEHFGGLSSHGRRTKLSQDSRFGCIFLTKSRRRDVSFHAALDELAAEG